MSKIVKKIKIMQPGGTLSDYVSIGAEAEDINVDGESVETKLGKKPYYYNTVADMKADTKLKTGDMAVTLGYYEVNDGGGAEYIIVNDNTLVADNGSVHVLTNSLRAVLLDNETVNVKMFGAYGDDTHDDSQSFINAIIYSNNIFVPKGTYLINNNINIEKTNSSLNIFGENQTSILKTTQDIEIFTFNSSSLNLSMNNLHILSTMNREHLLITLTNLPKVYINKCYISGGDITDSTHIAGMSVNNCVITTIENSIFSNAVLDLNTWDVKIDKSWFWSVSQDYCLKTTGLCGNIKITNSDFVPQFVSRNSNYIFTADATNENWSTAMLQGAIIIGDLEHTVSGVEISNCYIDGGIERSGRGIIINRNCFNVIIDNIRSNLINDNLITIDSAYNINITNCNLFNYGVGETDKVNFVGIYKKATQGPNVSILHNTINAFNTYSSITPIIYIDSNVGTSSFVIDYNRFVGNTSKKSFSTEIEMTYNPDVIISHNLSSGVGSHRFKTSGTFDVASGATSTTVTFTPNYGFPYQLRPDRIKIMPNNKIVPRYRMMSIPNNNSQFYIQFEEALSSDTTFYYTAEM